MKAGAIDVSFNHCGMSVADWWEYEKEALKRPTYPFTFSNEPLADAFYEAFKAAHPTATYFKGDGVQYVCLDDRAVKRLARTLKKSAARQAEALERLNKLIEDVEAGKGATI